MVTEGDCRPLAQHAARFQAKRTGVAGSEA